MCAGATMVEISRLIDDAALIEIEADAMVRPEHQEHISTPSTWPG